jgi:hypothetical protein
MHGAEKIRAFAGNRTPVVYFVFVLLLSELLWLMRTCAMINTDVCRTSSSYIQSSK